MKRFFLLFASVLLFCGCAKKEDKKIGTDFESLMGKDLPCWQFVQTPEDFENIHFFKTLYEQNLPLMHMKSKLERIPKTIHFIWVGPNPFPRESIDNVRT